MQILFLAHRGPYPPNKGEKIRAFHELRFLAARHVIDLFCFADSAEEAEHQEALRPLCRHLYVETLNPAWAMLRACRGLWRKEPLTVRYFHSPAFRDAVQQALARGNYDLIFVYCSSMVPYVPRPAPAPVVVDFVDADSAKWGQYARFSRFPLSWVYARESRFLARYERQVVGELDASVVATREEAAQLGGDGRLPVEVIRNGVSLPPESSLTTLPDEIQRLQPYVLFVGTMNYRPNIDAVVYFSEQVLPRVRARHPELRFVVVGRDPVRAVRKLARQPGVTVTGAVPDVQPYLRGATAAVAPFRICQGVQNKILEALAGGLPVVSTPKPARAVGLEGLECLLVAETPDEFARAVISIQENPQLRSRCREMAKLVREELDWDRNLLQLERLLERVRGSPEGMAVGAPNHAEIRWQAGERSLGTP